MSEAPKTNISPLSLAGPEATQSPLSPLGAATERLTGFSAEARTRIANGEDPTQLQNELKGMAGTNLQEMLKTGAYTSGELRDTLAAVHEADNIVGGSDSSVDAIIGAAGSTAMSELSQEEGGILDQIVDKAAAQEDLSNPMRYNRLVFATETATRRRGGNAFGWRKGGRPITDAGAVGVLARHEQFPDMLLNRQLARAEQEPDPARRDAILRDTERGLFKEALGLDAETSKDMRLGMELRTMRRDAHGRIIPAEHGGGIDATEWGTVMRRTVFHHRNLGSGGMKQLHDKAGITNFDKFKPHQLEQTRLLVSDRPEDQQAKSALIARLKKGNIRLAMSDTMDPQPDGSSTMPFAFDSPQTIHMQIRGATDFYRHPAYLKSLGLEASSIALGVHGGRGLMGGGRGDTAYIIMNTPSARPIQETRMYLDQSHIDRLMAEYTKPHTETGERELILISCYQAEEGEGSAVSPAENIAGKMDHRLHVKVYAGHAAVNVATTPDGSLQFVHPVGEGQQAVPAKATVFQNQRRPLGGTRVTRTSVDSFSRSTYV